MRPYLNAVAHAGIEDELGVLLEALRAENVRVFRVLRCLEDAQKALDYMVTMNIETQSHNVLLELVDDHHQMGLKLWEHLVEHLNQKLDSSGSMDVHRDICDAWQDSVDYLSNLSRG